MPKSEAFWAAARERATEKTSREKWKRAKAGALGVTIGPKGSAKRYKTKVRFRKPRRTKAWISVGPELSRITSDMMEAVAPALSEAFDDEMGPWAMDVLNKWPRFSGMSAATVDLNYITGPKGTFTASLVIRAPYALVVPGGKANKLVFSKVKGVSRRIAERAAADMAKV